MRKGVFTEMIIVSFNIFSLFATWEVISMSFSDHFKLKKFVLSKEGYKKVVSCQSLRNGKNRSIVKIFSLFNKFLETGSRFGVSIKMRLSRIVLDYHFSM